MPQHVQFKKALKVSEKARKRNASAKSRINKMVKKVKTAATKEEAQAALVKTTSVIDTTARKKIIKKKAAARKKSQLHKLVNKMK